LKETFPRIQYITTTHSPLIIASCKNEQLITIKDDMDIEYGNSAYGYRGIMDYYLDKRLR